MSEQQNPEHQLEYLKELRAKYEAVLADAQKSGDYTEAKKLKEELDQRLTALEALFPKPEAKAEPVKNNIENEEFDEHKFEQITVAILKSYLENGFISPSDVLSNLTAMDNNESMKLRDQAYVQMVATNQDSFDADLLMLKSYAGVDNEVAWKTRDRNMAAENYLEVLISVAGLDTQRAWEIRGNYNIHVGNTFALSLTGLDADQAWRLRNHMLEEQYKDAGVDLAVLKSIAGLDSERAWALREDTLEDTMFTNTAEAVAVSLVGLDSVRAWDMRREISKIATDLDDRGIQHTANIGLAKSLAGLESDQAWKWRNKLNAEGKINESGLSLAGLNSDRAWRVRGNVRALGLSPADFVSSYNGDLTTAIGWRTARKNQKKQT